MFSKFAELSKKYFSSKYHYSACVGAGIGFLQGSWDDKNFQKSSAYCIAGYFYPIIIPYQATKYLLNNK